MTKKRLLALAALTCAFAPVAKAQSTFSDVPDNHWAAEAVKRLVEAGIIVGRPVPVSIRQKPVMPPSSSDNEVTAVEHELRSARELSGADISVKNGDKKTLFLDGYVQTRAQESEAVSIARSIATGWIVSSRLLVK